MIQIRFDNDYLPAFDSTSLFTFDMTYLSLNPTENVERSTNLSYQEEYEFQAISPISSLVEFDKNTVTLSKILESIIR